MEIIFHPAAAAAAADTAALRFHGSSTCEFCPLETAFEGDGSFDTASSLVHRRPCGIGHTEVRRGWELYGLLPVCYRFKYLPVDWVTIEKQCVFPCRAT